MIERTRWGTICTSINKETGAVTQSLIRGGEITTEEFNPPEIPDEILGKRQESNLLISHRLNFLSKVSLVVTIIDQIINIKRNGRFNVARGLIGGFIAVSSHLASDSYLNSADLDGFRREEIKLQEIIDSAILTPQE